MKKLIKRGDIAPKGALDFPSLEKWFFPEPFFEFPSLFSENDSFFRGKTPSFDISETDENIIVEADIPGFDPKDVVVEIDDNTVSIEGKMEKEEEKKEKKYYRKERSSASFHREFSLPPYADADKASSKTQNGMLTITIPKKKTSSSSQKKKLKIEKK